MLQDSQERSPKPSKNRCRINTAIVVWEYKKNIQPISRCYADKISTLGFDIVIVSFIKIVFKYLLVTFGLRLTSMYELRIY